MTSHETVGSEDPSDSTNPTANVPALIGIDAADPIDPKNAAAADADPELQPSAGTSLALADEAMAQESLTECSVRQRNKALLLMALKAMDITEAIVEYEGSGDSGGVSDVKLDGVDGSVMDATHPILILELRHDYEQGAWHAAIEQVETPLYEALCDFAADAVSAHYPGWEINDGARGKVVFCSVDGTAKLCHSTYYVESEDSAVDL